MEQRTKYLEDLRQKIEMKVTKLPEKEIKYKFEALKSKRNLNQAVLKKTEIAPVV